MNDRDHPPAALCERFARLCAEPSDINEHLGVLWGLARQCEHVTEFGVRGAVSTTALLMGQSHWLECYDVAACPALDDLRYLAGLTFLFRYQADSREVDIVHTDMLHIDTLHNYACLSVELRLHAPKVKKWIALHDTNLFGVVGDDGGAGLNKAVDELVAGGKWRVWARFPNCNGMTILQRTADG